MKLIAVLLALILITSSLGFVDATKFKKPIIFINDVIPSRMDNQYIVFLSICTPKLLKYPEFTVKSDVDYFDLQYNKLISKNKCASFSLTVGAENPDSIKVKLI